MKKHKEKDKPKSFTDHSTLLGRFFIFFSRYFEREGMGYKRED